MSGNVPLSVEAGARVMVPRRWRDASPDGLWTVAPWPVAGPRCLAAFPPEAWEDRLNKVELAAIDEGDRIIISKAMNHRAVDLTLDKVGRLCLGQSLANRIKLEGQAVLAGCGDHFEIYTPEEYAAMEKEFDEIPLEQLKKLGLV